MSATIPAVYVQTYERTVRQLAQQGITRLRPWTQERNVQSEGHIVANNHLAPDADNILVTLHDNTELPAKLVSRDRRVNISFLNLMVIS